MNQISVDSADNKIQRQTKRKNKINANHTDNFYANVPIQIF